MGSGLSIAQLVSTAWASASTFRCTDRRGGANGARIRLAPQKDWEVNQGTAEVIAKLEEIQGASGKISLADLIVLGGCAAVEAAAKNAGIDVQVPFNAGRTDATQEMTDVASFAWLEPTADGFRNYYAAGNTRKAEELLVDRSHMLSLTAPQMTVLVGGLRAMNANYGRSQVGVLTKTLETLDNAFFVNLLDMGTRWSAHPGCPVFEGKDATTGEAKWTGSAVDLIFGSNSQLRAITEVYAGDDAKEKFVVDFVAAWSKVMENDRFDLQSRM